MKIQQAQWTKDGAWQPALPSVSDAFVQVVFLFGGSELITENTCLGAVRRVYPRAHIFGCSTAGEIHNATVRDDTITLTAVSFEHTRIATSRVQIENPERSFEAGELLARQMPPTGLRHVFVLAEGVNVNASELVTGLNAGLPLGVTASGGCAGDGNQFHATKVWCDCPPQESSAVALGFYGSRFHANISAIGGWKPFGPNRIITKASRNILYKIDNRPALALYKEYLGEHTDGLPSTGLMYPLELSLGNGRRVLRAPLEINETEQSIAFGGNLPEGAYARFMVGHPDDLIEGTRLAAKRSVASLISGFPELSILVSCSTRRKILKQRTEEEISAVCNFLKPATAVTGFYAFGEIASPQGGGAPEFHNETLVVTSLSEI